MDARFFRAVALTAAACCLGASHRTQNFVVSAPTPQMARQIGEAAEEFRRDLAVQWLGSELPRWAEPCPITAQVGQRLGVLGVRCRAVSCWRGGDGSVSSRARIVYRSLLVGPWTELDLRLEFF